MQAKYFPPEPSEMFIPWPRYSDIWFLYQDSLPRLNHSFVWNFDLLLPRNTVKLGYNGISRNLIISKLHADYSIIMAVNTTDSK
jgi:hypothetical protein